MFTSTIIHEPGIDTTSEGLYFSDMLINLFSQLENQDLSHISVFIDKTWIVHDLQRSWGGAGGEEEYMCLDSISYERNYIAP